MQTFNGGVGMSTRNEEKPITPEQALEIAQTVPLPDEYYWCMTHNSVGIRIRDTTWWLYWWSIGAGYNLDKYLLGDIICHEQHQSERVIGHFAPTVEEAAAACQFMLNKLTFWLYE
jgi:hypothetical protein